MQYREKALLRLTSVVLFQQKTKGVSFLYCWTYLEKLLFQLQVPATANNSLLFWNICIQLSTQNWQQIGLKVFLKEWVKGATKSLGLFPNGLNMDHCIGSAQAVFASADFNQLPHSCFIIIGSFTGCLSTGWLVKWNHIEVGVQCGSYNLINLTITQLIHCFKSLHHLNLYFKCKALSVVQWMIIKHNMFLLFVC